MLENTERIFTVEDHMTQGGLGSLIAESLSSMSMTTSLFMKGLDDFVGSGKPSELEKRYLLDTSSIVSFILNKIKK